MHVQLPVRVLSLATSVRKIWRPRRHLLLRVVGVADGQLVIALTVGGLGGPLRSLAVPPELQLFPPPECSVKNPSLRPRQRAVRRVHSGPVHSGKRTLHPLCAARHLRPVLIRRNAAGAQHVCLRPTQASQIHFVHFIPGIIVSTDKTFVF